VKKDAPKFKLQRELKRLFRCMDFVARNYLRAGTKRRDAAVFADI